MDVKTLFDAGAMQYDMHRRKVIPCFDDFYKIAVEQIPFNPAESFSFLDLGTGTGLLTALIFNAFPRARANVLDVSEKMLAKARQRFTGNPDVAFFAMDYAETPLPGIYDLVVSAMSIHHLSHAGKAHLMEKIYQALRPGGLFIHAELAKGATDATEKSYQQHWTEHLEQTGLSADQLAVIAERMSCDRPATLDDQLMWLEQAGFTDVDCFYKYYNFVVIAGKKPATENQLKNE
jgi:tRNA (cmo5U34)-methyltransferase